MKKKQKERIEYKTKRVNEKCKCRTVDRREEKCVKDKKWISYKT